MMMPKARFVGRDELAGSEWDNQRKDWKRPGIDREVLRRLSERSTLNGLARIAWFVLLLAASAVAAVYVSRISPWLAMPVLYLYWFFYGFWVAIVHELQHGTVFARSRLSNGLPVFSCAGHVEQPDHARISHRLHHRYTMVRGVDPETDWPEVITTRWLRGFLVSLVLRILVVGALFELYRSVRLQIERAAGRKDRMMRDHCSEQEVAAIRIESLAILLVHVAVAAAAIVFRRWELLAFVTLAWHVGSPMEILWHATKHIGRPYNVNDHRLNTRSVRVGWFIKSFFWGLDDHVDHHLYPRPRGTAQAPSCWKDL
jgi:fatty acid desaturase